jgi:hypothetical protein
LGQWASAQYHRETSSMVFTFNGNAIVTIKESFYGKFASVDTFRYNLTNQGKYLHLEPFKKDRPPFIIHIIELNQHILKIQGAKANSYSIILKKTME